MHVTAEIQSKEKSLADLMSRILKEPFKPLSESIKKLEGTVLDSEEKLEEIQNSLGVFSDDAEKAKKEITKALRSIRDENLPELASDIQKHLIQNTENITTSIDQYSNYFKSVSENIISCLSEANTHRNKIEHALYELQTQHRSYSERASTSQAAITTATQTALNEMRSNRELMESHQADLVDRLNTSGTMLENNMKVAASSTQATLQEIKANRELNEKVTKDLGIQFDLGLERLAAEMRKNSADINAVATQQVHAETAAIALMERHQTASLKALGQLNGTLVAQLTTVQSKLHSLTTITAVFFVCTLSYVGYDVWSRIH